MFLSLERVAADSREAGTISDSINMGMPVLSDAQRFRPVLLVLACCLSALGCADARGRFEDFQDRLSDAGAGAPVTDGGGSDATGGGGPCIPPAPGTVSGPALL